MKTRTQYEVRYWREGSILPKNRKYFSRKLAERFIKRKPEGEWEHVQPVTKIEVFARTVTMTEWQTENRTKELIYE